MPKVIVEGSQDTAAAKQMSRSLDRGHNRAATNEVYPMVEPLFHVHLFNVGRRDGLKTETALLGPVEILPCRKKEDGTWQRYVRFCIPIPEPFPQRVEDTEGTGRDPFVYHRGNSGGMRVAQDICDASNPTLNQDIEDYGKIDAYFAVQNGTNFAKQGAFWSKNSTPAEDEILRAEKKRDKFYRYCINLYDKFSQEDPKAMERLMGASGFDSRDVRIALDFFGEERPGYKRYKPVTDCPNCGKSISAGIAFHPDEYGDLCIIDWRRTVNAGKRTLEQVPVDMRWEGFKLPAKA
jgi:hypothetical protein